MADSFAASVLAAIRSASLEDLIQQSGRAAPRRAGAPAVASRGSGRRIRRSATDIASLVDSIESLLVKNPKGLRAEQIRKELGLEAKNLPRPLAEGISQKRFSKSGQKRATTYFAKGGGGAKAAPARRRAKKRG